MNIKKILFLLLIFILSFSLYSTTVSQSFDYSFSTYHVLKNKQHHYFNSTSFGASIVINAQNAPIGCFVSGDYHIPVSEHFINDGVNESINMDVQGGLNFFYGLNFYKDITNFSTLNLKCGGSYQWYKNHKNNSLIEFKSFGIGISPEIIFF